MDRRVALKVLPGGIAADTRASARFLREAQTAGKLSHPNVVPVYFTGVKEQTPFYAMEYVEGETLAQIVPRLKDTEPETKTAFGRKDCAGYFENLAKVFADVADGLQHAHSKGVIHRDIKPSNLILDAEGRLRILDFGLARLEGQETLTISGDLVGTPLYMSPEQARQKKIPVDHRTDIYSLGATMYEAITGGPPFKGKDHQDTLSQITERDPIAPRKLNQRVPQDLETVVLKCLRKDVGDRYGTAEAMAQDLRRFARGDPIEARPQGRWELLARKLRVHRGRLIVAASVALALLFGAAAAGLYLSGERNARLERTRRAVHAAMAEAIEFRGEARRGPEGVLTKWEAAVAAARRAQELAIAGDADEELTKQATQLLGDIEQAASSMQERAEILARDTAMVELLEGIREERGPMIKLLTEQAQYAGAFREYGIDIDALDPDESARRIRASWIAEALCAALDEWAFVCGRAGKDEGAERLLEIARAADTDAWRRAVRGTVLEGDLEKLEELSHEIEGGELDSMAVTLVVQSLDHLGRDREATVELLRKAQRRRPGDFWINYSLAGSLQRKKHADSIRFFHAALALRPTSADVRDRLGLALEASGDLDGAIEVWREALRVRPDYFHAFEHLIPALKKKGIAVVEIDAVREALDLEPGDAGAYVGVGLALRRAKKWSEAVEAYRMAAQLRGSGDIYYYLGRALYWKAHCDGCLGKETRESVLEEAIAACEKGLRAYEKEHFPRWECSRVWAIIGGARTALGVTEGAIEAYEEALRLNPYCYEAYGIVDILSETGRFADAVSYYRQGLRSGFPLLYFPNNHAVALRSAGRHDEAIAFCQGELPHLRGRTERHPDHAGFRLSLGAVLCDQLQDFDGAIKEFQKAIELQPKNPTAYTFLGVASGQKGDPASAIEAYQECVNLQAPHRAWRVRGALGDQFRTTSDLDQAALHYREALRFEKTAWIHRGLGFALLGRGEVEKGLEHLEKYHELEEWPEDPFYPHDRWKEECKALARLSTQFSSILRGDTAIADPRDRLRFAWLCSETGFHAQAARFYLGAFAADAGLADKPFPEKYTVRFRAAAAFAAAWPAAGQEKEADTLDEAARARWLRQAIVWLREDLEQWEKELERATERQRKRVREALSFLKFQLVECTLLCTLLRYEGNLARLPQDEQEACRAFWKDLDRMLARAKGDAGRGFLPQKHEATTGSEDSR